jgi:PAS domain S-box-containing protein
MTSADQPGSEVRQLSAALVFDGMEEMVVLHELCCGPDGAAHDYRLLDCNRSFTRITGIAREAAVGRLASEVYGEVPYLEVYSRVARSGVAETFETHYRPMDRHFTISVVSPGPGRFVTITGDVTERRRAEAALRRYHLLAESSHDIVLFVRPDDGQILDANAAALSAYGFSREDLLRRSVVELRAPGTRTDTALQLATANERGIRFETVHRRSTGDTFPVEVTSRGATLDGARVLMSIVRDVTERKQAEARLAAERERLAVTLRSIGDGVIATDAEARVTLVNDVAARLTGWTSAEAAGRPLTEVFRIVSEETRLPASDPAEKVLRSGETVALANHTALIARDGGERPISDSGAPIRDSEGRIAGTVLVFRDQTEERRAERALRESEQRYRNLLEVAPDAIYVHSDDRIVFANPAAVRLFGVRDAAALLGRSPLELFHPDDRSLIRARIAGVVTGRSAPLVEERVVRPDGEVRYVEVVGAPLSHDGRPAVQAILRDVTDRKAAEAERARLQGELADAQKLETIGRLAGGIAHDFNNLLTVILSCSEALRTDVASGAGASPEDIEDISEAGGRARELTRQLLAFARKQVIAPVALEVNALVQGSEKLLRRVLAEDVQVVVRLAQGLRPVRCDPGQLEQVLMNLAVNARDAMPAGGSLTIETSACTAAEAGLEGSDGWIRLAIGDTGVGMNDEVKAHLFEPFFTTKPRGKGSGLGLATVYGIVKQSGGAVRVDSAPGRGTTVVVFLPCTDEAVQPAPPPAPTRVTAGDERVLVVEDDASVRDVTVRALRGAGYRVFSATSLEVVNDRAGEGELAELLVTDVIMPDADGHAVAEAFRHRHPDARVLYVSGYSDEILAHRGVLEPGIAILPKPFTPTALLARVRALLDAAEPGHAPSPGRLAPERR